MNDTVSIPEVTDLDIASPTKALVLLPPMADIPEEFKRGTSNKWVKVVSDWFFHGEDAKGLASIHARLRRPLGPLDKVCMGDWSPQHEHKEAGVAYLLSQWFEDVAYTLGKANMP